MGWSTPSLVQRRRRRTVVPPSCVGASLARVRPTHHLPVVVCYSTHRERPQRTAHAVRPSQHILRVRSCVQRRIADGAELYHIKKTKPLAARWGGASAADERGLWDDGMRRTPMRMS